MNAADIEWKEAFEATGVELMARLYGVGGALVTQASVSSIAYTVSRYGSKDDAHKCVHGTEVITGGSLAKTSVIFDTLQTAFPWETDTAGYNFKYNSPATDRPAVSGGETYYHRYDVVFTPVSGAVYVRSFGVVSHPRQ